MVFQTTISIGKFSFSQYVTQQYVTAHCTRVKTHTNSKQAYTKFYPICLRRRQRIQLILSHLCQFWVFWEERRNRRTVFSVSICCVTADLTSFCHYYIALTSFAILEYSVQKLISQLFRNLFSIFSIAGLRTPLTSSRCQVGRSLPPSRAIHRTLPALQQVRPYYLKMLHILPSISISISISILSKDGTYLSLIHIWRCRRRG